MDAWGKIPANLLGGNFKWLGNIDECELIQANNGNETDIFTGKYCRVRLNLSTSIPKAIQVRCNM